MENKQNFLKQFKKPKLFNKKPNNFIFNNYLKTKYKNNRFSSYDTNNRKNLTLTKISSDYYYKNPFFYNNNSLNIQLKILKELSNYNLLSSTSTATQTKVNTNNCSSKTLNNKYIRIHPKIKSKDKLINNMKKKHYNSNLPTISNDTNKEDKTIKIEINDEENYHKDGNSIKTRSFLNTDQNFRESDEYFYKIIFRSKPIFKNEQKIIVDNKFNMIYAENEEQYKKIIEKEYIKLLSEGKKVKSKNNAASIKLKLNETKSKIRFMKGIMDYSYPGFVLSKIKIIQKKLNAHKNNVYYKNSINEMEKRNKEKNERNNFRREYLLKSITLNKKY